MTNVIDLTVRISAKNPRGQYLARIDHAISEVEDLLVLGRYYQKETVPELEQALGGIDAGAGEADRVGEECGEVSETDISRSIRDTLTSAGYHVERVNSGKVPTRNGWFAGASPGTPDTIVVSPYGWLETKTPSGKLSEAQRKWHARARARGVRVEVVRDSGVALRVVKAWERCEQP